MDALRTLIRERLLASPEVVKLIEAQPELRDDPSLLLRVLEERGLVDDLFAALEANLEQRPAWPAPESHASFTLNLRRDARAAAPAAAMRGLEMPAAPPGESACMTQGGSGSTAGLGGGGGQWQVSLRLDYGRAFLDFLEDSGALALRARELQWHVSFAGQRSRSRPVAAAVDPHFGASFMLALPWAGSKASLLPQHEPVHLVLTSNSSSRDDPWDRGASVVLASHLLEWRQCLAAPGPHGLTLELQGVGRRRQLAPGVLHAEVELLPPGPASTALGAEAVGAQIRTEEQRRAEVLRRVFEDLDCWWGQHHDLFVSRYVCLFAQTESCLFLPLTSFVTPLEAGRCLNSPGHALRWAGLLGSEARPAAESAEPRWHTLPALWARGQGTIEEKALLLCSLLLGFSLDAWCCLGTDVGGQPHAWVVVRDRGDTSRPADVVCWDVRTSTRISVDTAQYLTTYTSIDVVFNDRRILVCHADAAARTAFDFSDPRCWLAVPLEGKDIDALRLYPAGRRPPFAGLRPCLWPLPAEAHIIEEDIEQRLAAAVRAHREAAGLQTTFDPHLGQLAHLALANLEAERAGSGKAQAPTFEDIVQRICSEGEVFRAVPAQFNHLRLSQFWPALCDRAAVREALALVVGPPVFAVRARVVPYPEGNVATWVLLAVRSRG